MKVTPVHGCRGVIVFLVSLMEFSMSKLFLAALAVFTFSATSVAIAPAHAGSQEYPAVEYDFDPL